MIGWASRPLLEFIAAPTAIMDDKAVFLRSPGVADNSPETVRPTCGSARAGCPKKSNACYGPKPRFMSQSG